MELTSKSSGLDFGPIVMIHELVARDLSPPAFVDALECHARGSRAVRHSLLERIADGAFQDPAAALRRFFGEYYHASRHFAGALASVLTSLEPSSVAVALVPDEVAGPRPMLLRRFLLAIGLHPEELDATTPHVATAAWIQSFEALCCAHEAAAVGALGLATEDIARGMEQKLLAGTMRVWPALTSRGRAFFEFHPEVHGDHAQVLRDVAVELATTSSYRRALAAGVLGALDARASFYDQMEIYLLSVDGPEVTP